MSFCLNNFFFNVFFLLEVTVNENNNLKGENYFKKKWKKEREQSLINCWLVLQTWWGFFSIFLFYGREGERERERNIGGERWHTCTCKWWSKRRFIDVENVMRLMGVSGPLVLALAASCKYMCWAMLERSQG